MTATSGEGPSRAALSGYGHITRGALNERGKYEFSVRTLAPYLAVGPHMSVAFHADLVVANAAPILRRVGRQSLRSESAGAGTSPGPRVCGCVASRRREDVARPNLPT